MDYAIKANCQVNLIDRGKSVMKILIFRHDVRIMYKGCMIPTADNGMNDLSRSRIS